MSRTYVYSRSNNFARKRTNLSRKLKFAFGLALLFYAFYVASQDIQPLIQSFEIDLTSRIAPLQEDPLAE